MLRIQSFETKYLGWVSVLINHLMPLVRSEIDYYGVTFDHLVLVNDLDPGVL
ncbi:hypothetical protein F4680DRAFT_422508 [Xylaria scruposa]|nr:hypothetical protein F4680DRAFT_422508 [Xylaria scruposa]